MIVERFKSLWTRRPGTIAISGVVLVGLLVHGLSANKLGLYWDDADYFIEGLQAVNGDRLRFVFSVTLEPSSERPFSHFAFLIARAGFASSLSALHWTLVSLLALAAVLLAILAQRIANEAWFSFAVGVVFLTYPLAPIQWIWPSTVHYAWAASLSLLAMLFFLRGMKANEKRPLRWFVFASVTYLASLLTHEVFAFIPPAFVILCLLLKGRGQDSTKKQSHFDRSEVRCLFLFLVTAGVYGLWRVLIQPTYGHAIYSSSEVTLKVGVLAEKALVGANLALFPWNDAVSQVLRHSPSVGSWLLAAGVSVIVWIITLSLWFHQPELHTADLKARSPLTGGREFRTVAIGFGLTAAALAAVALSPYNVGSISEPDLLSKTNFVMVLGVALALPAGFVLWAWFYERSPAFAALVVLGFLLLFGLDSPVLDLSLWFDPSVFAKFSLIHRSVIIVYLAAVIFVGLLVILFPTYGTRSFAHLPGSEKIVPGHDRIRAQFLAGSLACLTFIGSLYHLSVKEEYIKEWNQHKSMLQQLRIVAPALKNNTFVVLVHKPSRQWSATYNTHYEISSYLLALYDNWSIMGNAVSNLRFYRDGVESRYARTVAKWFPPGVRGPVQTHATLPVPRISYDRLLLFEFDGHKLRMPPKIMVKTEEGGPLLIGNNPERILDRAPTRTAVWSYIERP